MRWWRQLWAWIVALLRSFTGRQRRATSLNVTVERVPKPKPGGQDNGPTS
jgi:hypothetical protein